MQINPNNFRVAGRDYSDSRLDAFDQAAWDTSFDINEFDDGGIYIPDSLPDASTVFKEVELSVTALESVLPSGAELSEQLFPLPVCSRHRISDHRTSLWGIVVRAYQEVRCDRSVDYVVTEPESNLLFLQRCWELGAAASPFDLNWMLMNARKDSRMPPIERSRPVSLRREVFDEVSYAADIAMRELQDDLYFNKQRDRASVDLILCNPHLARQFDTLASRICPGHEAFDYRWAVLSLRKARRAKAKIGFPDGLREMGFMEDIQSSSMPTGSGLYWIRSASNSLFVGVASDLRRQVISFVDRLSSSVLPGNESSEKPRLLVMEAGVTCAELYRTRLLRDSGSLLNFHLCSSFLPAA